VPTEDFPIVLQLARSQVMEHASLIITLCKLPAALTAVARTLERGRDKYPADEGFKESSSFHIARAVRHLHPDFRYLSELSV
jgi:hypothetical protein